MASTIVTPNVSFMETMYEEVEPQLPCQTDEFKAALADVRHLLTIQQVDAIWMAAMTMLSTSTEGAFKAGWQLRGQL